MRGWAPVRPRGCWSQNVATPLNKRNDNPVEERRLNAKAQISVSTHSTHMGVRFLNVPKRREFQISATVKFSEIRSLGIVCIICRDGTICPENDFVMICHPKIDFVDVFCFVFFVNLHFCDGAVVSKLTTLTDASYLKSN